MNEKIKIIIVDDNPIFLDGIITFLNKALDCEIMACFQSGHDLLKNIGEYRPDLILLDIEMSGLNGIETARRLNILDHDVKLIAITLYHDNVYIKQLIEAGFRGFVNKNAVTEKLAEVIRRVLKNEFAFPDLRIL